MINVLRLDRWIDPVFDETLKADPGIRLQVAVRSAPFEANGRMLREMDIYHTPSSKKDAPPDYRITSAFLARHPRLKVVSCAGVGYDSVDVKACTDAGVLIVNQAGGNADSVAEHAFGLMLALAHRIVETDRALIAGTESNRRAFMGCELSGKVLGVVGIGHVGSRMAQLAKAFRMPVLAFDPYVERSEIQNRGAAPASSLTELLEASDVVSLHCPSTEETAGMIGHAQFRSMKKAAFFITTARGGIHDEEALFQALESGHLGGAGLDVWQTEPPHKEHPLLALPNVISTYHTAGVTHEARHNVALIAARQIIDICSGDMPPRMINPGVYPGVRARFCNAGRQFA